MITKKEQFEIDSQISDINEETKDIILTEYPLEKQNTISLNALKESQVAINQIFIHLGITPEVDMDNINNALEMYTFINTKLSEGKQKKDNLK